MIFRWVFSLAALAALLADGWEMCGGWAGHEYTTYLCRKDGDA